MGCFPYATQLCEPDDTVCLFSTTERVLNRAQEKNATFYESRILVKAPLKDVFISKWLPSRKILETFGIKTAS